MKIKKTTTKTTLFLVPLLALIATFKSVPVLANPSVADKAKTKINSATPAVKEWTFLTFLNGHNNLDSFGKMNIKQMEQIGSNENINIVVQWASSKNSTTKRLYIEKSKDSTNVTSPVVQDMPRVDMGDYKSLVDFVTWAHKNYPAKHYFINVWNHGNGWKLNQKLNMNLAPISAQDISYDDHTGHKITTEELGQAMNQIARVIGHKVDIYGSDACLMASFEVAAEMADSVDYFVGSEELEPGEGWPYKDFLSGWNRLFKEAAQNKQEVSAHSISELLVAEYYKAYSGGVYGDSNDVTFSAFDLTKMDQLNMSIKSLSQFLLQLDKTQLSQVYTIGDRSQSFFYSDYVDFGDFMTRLSKDKSFQRSDLNQILGQVYSDFSQFVIANAVTAKYTSAKGATIWLPAKGEWSSLASRYDKLRFSEATDWSRVLQRLYQ